jgi:NitT/TauT family transport system substrate-binding protein
MNRVFEVLLRTFGALLLLQGAAFAQEVVRIVNIGHGYYAGPLYVALHEKIFEKHGLKPDVTFVKGGALAYQAVLSRNADFGVLSYEHVITAASQGKDLVSVFNITTRPMNNVIATKALSDEYKDADIETKVRALKGKKVGTPSAGGSGEKMLGVLAKQYGLKLPGDVELVYLGTDAAPYVGAFRGKLIDAGVPFEPAGAVVEQEGLGRIFINLMNGSIPQFRDLVFMSVVVGPDTIREKPETVRKVIAVFAEAQKILLDPARGKPIMAAEFPDMSSATNDKAYETVRQIWSTDGRMTLEGAKKVYDFLQPSGTPQIVYERTFTNEFLPKN